MRSLILAVLAILAVANSASATTLYEKERTCPVGGETFKSFGVGSTSFFGMRLDLMREGVGAFLPYIECPNGFIIFKDESEFTADEIAKLTPVVLSPEYQAARTNEVTAMRVIMLRRALGESDIALRHLFFKAATEAEFAKAENLHTKYLKMAVDAYSAFLMTHKEHDNDWWFSAVRRADLLRQSSRFDEAATAIKELQSAHASENVIYLKVASQIEALNKIHNAASASYVEGGN